MDATRAPVALGPGEGEALWCAGALSIVKASAAQTGGAYSLIEDLAPRDSGPPLHLHRDDDEAFYILEGAMTFFWEGQPSFQASTGSFIHIPGGTAHAFRVDSDTARYLIITTPQHERFYRTIAEPARTRSIPPVLSMDLERVGAACEAYGVAGVGPRPDEG